MAQISQNTRTHKYHTTSTNKMIEYSSGKDHTLLGKKKQESFCGRQTTGILRISRNLLVGQLERAIKKIDFYM
jgi:hypothetical protein